ncbi:hypothetical protein L3Q67_32010 [Saccharothrix sp. AJ9571]|nr:hypothetical protein L3Q67_32010 [Saccharothrix sp. AJ9571]
MKVRSEWSYAWRDRTEEVDLATTELNAGPFSSKSDASDPAHNESAQPELTGGRRCRPSPNTCSTARTS